jgi:dihydroorotase
MGYNAFAWEDEMAYDLLIKGGTVIDPSQGLNGERDIALADGKVASIAESISESEAIEVFDATGLIVAPGLLDLHVHVFQGVSHYGVDPDIANLAKGVTTALDAGTAGAGTFPAFRKHVLEQADTQLYALLNISGMGMISRDIRGVGRHAVGQRRRGSRYGACQP